MDDIFFLKLALSFIVGGAWIALTTVLAEKFGTKLGGIFAGLPIAHPVYQGVVSAIVFNPICFLYFD